MNRWPLRCVAPLTLLVCVVSSPGQNASKSGSSSSGSQSSSGQEEISNSVNFSIETEMFTYRAVEQNSEVIACDIARYLSQGELADAGAGAHAPCAVANPARSAPGVILISSSSPLLSNFQLWRADIATMSGLEGRANTVCVANPAAKTTSEQEAPPASSPPKIRSRGLTSSALGALKSTPPGEIASGIQEALQLFSSEQSVSSVIGTVQDPALMNEVSRQLRALNVQVLIPELYNPNALGAIDDTRSPYLKALEGVFSAYSKCDKAKSTYSENAPEAADISSVISAIDSFLKITFAAPTTTTATPSPHADNSQEAGGSAPPPASTTSHFSAVMSADEVAAKIGFGENGVNGPDQNWQHILWLKALESGGSVTKQSNLFGTKVRFGGGAVDTYSLFRLDGQLVCSGNVYNFQMPVLLADLEKSFRAPLANPTHSPLLQSTCAALPVQ